MYEACEGGAQGEVDATAVIMLEGQAHSIFIRFAISTLENTCIMRLRIARERG